MTTYEKTSVTRRGFLGAAAAAGAAVASLGLAGCAGAPAPAKEADAGADETLSSTGATDWLGEEPATPESFAAEYEADIVVCGLGVAGVAALRTAAEAGLRVIGFDKADASRSSNEVCAFGSSLYAERYPDVAAHWEGMRPLILNAVSEGCLYRNDTRILRRYLDINGETVDWYFSALDESEYSFGTSENGGKVDREAALTLAEAVYPLPEHYDPRTENMPCVPGSFRMGGEQKGPGFLAANLARAQEAGAEYCTYTPAVKLLTDEAGRVTGVVARDAEGNFVKATAAKGVILATGDFMNNEAMLRTFLSAVLDQGYECFGPENYYTLADAEGKACNVGDGHRMAAWVGGKVQDFGASMSHFSKAANSSVFGTLPFLMLDARGRRFMNEDVQGQQFAERIRQLPRRQTIMVFDDAFEEQLPWMPYGHGKLPNTRRADVEARVEEGTLWKADTLEELFAQMDIDSEAAIASIERYNELCRKGVDEDFGKTPTRLFALERPPFYANYMTRGDDLVTMCGIVSDERCHAYNTEGEVIPGLYLAGNVQGNRFATIYPEIFMGYSIGMALAFGREAARVAAAE